jgi:2-C-methyl-D-erythritol 4-phosphate cytidylyltransferase
VEKYVVPSTGGQPGKKRVAVSVWTIVVAAGSGTRFGGLKQFEQLGSRRVVDWGIQTALRASDGVVVVLPADASPVASGVVGSVIGGATRSASVRNGLEAVPEDASVILVHDGARPFASLDLFDRVIDAVRAGADGAIPGVAVTDTIKRVSVDGTIIGTVERADLRAVQTPQAFRSGALRDAYIGGNDATDDAAVVEASGGRVVVVAGDPENRKITTPADLEWARQKVASV